MKLCINKLSRSVKVSPSNDRTNKRCVDIVCIAVASPDSMLVCISRSQRCANLICIMNIWIFINYVSEWRFQQNFSCCLYQFVCALDSVDPIQTVQWKLTAIPHDSCTNRCWIFDTSVYLILGFARLSHWQPIWMAFVKSFESKCVGMARFRIFILESL